MIIHVEAGDIHLIDLRTRMPFKYGIATMTESPHAFVRLRVNVAGQRSVGIAADHLPPKWFTKDPARSIADEVAEMADVIEHAVRIAAGLRGESPFAVWRKLHEAQGAWGRNAKLPPLLTHFGTSLVERALIEAVCRAVGQPFGRLLRTNQLGVRLGDLHPALADLAPADLLPDKPLETVIARHTIGLADPLTDRDIAPADRVDDGLPQSLEACIRAYGLRHFKIKVSGNLEHDRERILGIARLIQDNAPADFAFSLDGNEQFRERAAFADFWAGLTATKPVQRFFEHLLFVEQPFHRSVALDLDVTGGPPMIIDESDGDLDSLPRALERGYAGTSHKNCKEVFRGVINACLLARRKRDHPDLAVIMSGEDLANIGPVALLQDLTVSANLGVASIERNGHHYFAGLSMFPKPVQQQVLTAHGDLYHAGRDGWPTLKIVDGRLQLGSLLGAPFGVGFEANVEQFVPLDTWRRSHSEGGQP